MLRFKGSQQFRQRLVLSTLSGRPIRIDEIRSRDAAPGLRDYEASLLRLLEKCTNGCVVEINETGGCSACVNDNSDGVGSVNGLPSVGTCLHS
jgi:RNA 3'-terminal phosphate cyclase